MHVNVQRSLGRNAVIEIDRHAFARVEARMRSGVDLTVDDADVALCLRQLFALGQTVDQYRRTAPPAQRGLFRRAVRTAQGRDTFPCDVETIDFVLTMARSVSQRGTKIENREQVAIFFRYVGSTSPNVIVDA